MIEVRDAAWVAKALSPDSYRPVLSVAVIGCYKGSIVLVATDTHRIHMLRLGPVENEFPARLIDLRRVLFEARYAKATHIQIQLESSQVVVGRLASRGGLANSSLIHAPVFDTVKGTYPDYAKCIPETRRPVSEFFAINSKYLFDATEISRRDSFRTLMLSEYGENKPILFQPVDTEPRWLAVVMPMAIEGWAREANKEDREAVA